MWPIRMAMIHQAIFLLATILISYNIYSFPIVTEARDSSFSGVEDLSFRELLSQLNQVDFEKYPELGEVYQKVIALTEKLLIEEDGIRPIRIVLVDDMAPNAFYMNTVKGDRVIAINLGLLKILENDDELAFIIGHELEHGRSSLNRKVSLELANSHYLGQHTNMMMLHLLNRAAENEVDMKSVFRRVHENGMNPYASIDFLEKLKERVGDLPSDTHTTLSSRINTIEQELTGMTRILGERINKNNTNQVISPSVKMFIDSDKFIQQRKSNVESIMASYKERIIKLVDSIKSLENTPSIEFEEAKQKIRGEMRAVMGTYFSDKKKIVTELHGIVPDTEFLDYQLRHEAAFAQSLAESIIDKLGNNIALRTIDQFEIINTLLQNMRFTNPLMTSSRSTPFSLIDDKINLETSYRGSYGQERTSRRVTIEREVKKLRSERELLESGLDNLESAEETSSRAISFLPKNRTEVVPPEFRAAQREFERHIRHVGSWIKTLDELASKISTSYGNFILENPIGKNLVEAKKIYKSFPRDVQEQFFQQIIEKNIDHIIDLSQRTMGEQQKREAIINALNDIFGTEYIDTFRWNGHGLNDYISTYPDHFKSNMRKLYSSILRNTTDENIISIFFRVENLTDPTSTFSNAELDMMRYRHPIEFILSNDPMLAVQYSLYEEIVDVEMLHQASSIKFNSFYNRVFQNLEYKNMNDLFAILDEHFKGEVLNIKAEMTNTSGIGSSIRRSMQRGINKVIEFVNQGMPGSFKIETANMTGAGSLLRQSAQKNLNRIIELVKQRMPEKFKPLNEEFPELLDHIIKLSYFEASDLFNPPISQDKSNAIKQILDQFFLYLEKS